MAAVAPVRRAHILAATAVPQQEGPISLATRANDPILELIARSVYALFPRCAKCGERVERFEDADVRILTYRVIHREGCPSAGAEAKDS